MSLQFIVFSFLLFSAPETLFVVNVNIQSESHSPDRCDLIYPYDGEKIECVIKDINQEEIKYVMCSEPEGNVVSIARLKVRMITYADGRIQIVSKNPPRKEEMQISKDLSESNSKEVSPNTRSNTEGKKVRPMKTKNLGITIAITLVVWFLFNLGRGL